MGTVRAKMAPYMRELEKLVGYKSIKAKFGNVGNMARTIQKKRKPTLLTRVPLWRKMK